MKLKFDTNLVRQVRIGMIPKKNWLGVRTKSEDSECENCKRPYAELDTDIALMVIVGSTNKHVCEECGRAYIEAGAEDVQAEIKADEVIKDDLRREIHEIGIHEPAKDESIESLTAILEKSKAGLLKKQETEESMKKYDQSLDKYELEMLVILDSEDKLSESDISYLLDFEKVDVEEGEEHRWSRDIFSVIKVGDRFFSVDWSRGLTERQPNEFCNQPVEVKRVTYEKTTTVTEWEEIE